jgi:putative Holliday junction resolvase
VQSGSHPRYLGLDVGSRRIGVAVSDELGLTAQPVLTLERRGSGAANRREDLRSLARLCRRFGVAGIVVGNPLHLSGETSPRAAKTQAFAAELGELTGLPIHMWDERLTTRAAHEILYAAGHERQKHSQVVDQVAATLILQSFIDAREDEAKAALDR